MAIIEKLRQLGIAGSIVVMPDFFVDRIIRLESKEKLFDALAEKAKCGGGSVRGVPTTDVKGGNAVNVAYCLAKLGVKVALFTVADETGATMIRQAFSQFGEIEDAIVLTDRETGRSRGFGFVTFKNGPDGDRARQEMNGQQLDGRTINGGLRVRF